MPHHWHPLAHEQNSFQNKTNIQSGFLERTRQTKLHNGVWRPLKGWHFQTAKHAKQETPQCDKTRFSTLQPSVDMAGIKNERWQWRKNDAIILVASIACTKFGVKRYVIERKLILFSNSELDLDHRHLGSNPKLRLDVSYPYSKFGVNKP